jgi:putative hydrolase of the HAD superfamily
VTAPAICFDATGTLIEMTEGVGEVYHRVALEHGIDLPAWRLEDAFRRVLRHAPPRGIDGDTIAARERSEVDWWSERIRQTIQATDSSVRFEDFHAFAAALFDVYRAPERWRCRAGVARSLLALRDQNCSMAIVSNFDHRLPEILEGLDIARFFDAIVTPAQVGSSKPDRAIFEAVAKTLDRPIEQLYYVGDDAPEVLEAIGELGLRVFDIREIDDLEALANPALTAATLLPRT